MENINEKLDKALDLINEENYVGAQKELNEILSLEPENLEAIKNLGLCEVNLDNPPEAIALFKKALELEPEDATSIFYLASCLSRVGEKELALEKFKEVLALRPDYLDVYKNIAMIYVEHNDFENAIKTVEIALNNPSIEPDYSLYYIAATSYMLKKDTNYAIKYLKEAFKCNKENLSILNSLGSCYMNVGDYKNAKEVLHIAYEQDNKNPLSAFNLGVLYQTVQNYSEAVKYFQIAYQLEPTITMLSSLANCTLKAGDYASACVMYQNLSMLYPNNLEYAFSYITALEETEQFRTALDALEKIISLDEKNVDFIKKKGTLLRKIGLNEESIETFNQLVKRGKIDVEVYYNLAFNYAQMDDYNNACEMFKKCIILEPNNPYAHKDLGVLYLKMNCYEWAVDEMLEAIRLEDDIAEFHYSLAVSYIMLSKIEEGKKALENALKYSPDDCDALAFLGYAYMLQDDFDNAFIYLDKAIKINPDSFLAKNHLAKYYFKIEKYSVAKQFLQDLIEQSNDSECLNMLSLCYLKEENYQDALGVLNKLVKDFPKNHILLTNLAKCEFKCGKKDEAIEHLRQALMIFDDYKEALDLLEEINNGK